MKFEMKIKMRDGSLASEPILSEIMGVLDLEGEANDDAVRQAYMMFQTMAIQAIAAIMDIVLIVESDNGRKLEIEFLHPTDGFAKSFAAVHKFIIGDDPPSGDESDLSAFDSFVNGLWGEGE